VEAVERTVASFVEETGVEASATVTGQPVTAAPAEEVVALRVVQEGLTNVRRHAGAHHVRVGLACGAGVLVVNVADDGAGFDAAGSRTGFGLAGMRARAEEIGGTVEITSAPGEGTTVTTTVPIGASS
jgi:signal transduction histidine kinase